MQVFQNTFIQITAGYKEWKMLTMFPLNKYLYPATLHLRDKET